MELPYKKRHRVPASCSVCRKRKSKCDRVKPICGSCKKKSIAHLCFYENDTLDSDPIPSHIHHIPEQPVGPPPHQYYPPQGQNPPPGHGPPPPILHQLPPHGPHGPHVNHGPPSQLHQQQQPGAHQMGPGPISQVLDYSNPNQNAHFKQQPPPPPPPNQGGQNQPPSFPYPVSEQSDNSFLPAPHSASISSSGALQFAYSPTESNVSMSSISNQPPFVPGLGPQQSSSFSSSKLVSIPLGPNSSLQVNPDDKINVFTNASYSLNLEGTLWQHQGTLSYIGLTKSDMFIKILRNYAIFLFKTGGMAKFMRLDKPKKRHHVNGGTSSCSSSVVDVNATSGHDTSVPSPGQKRQRIDTLASTGSMNTSPSSIISESDPRKDIDADQDEMVVEDDALIVTKIAVSRDNDASSTDNEEDGKTEGEGDEEIAEAEQDITVDPKIKKHKRNKVLPQILPGLGSLYNGKKTRQDYYRLVEKTVSDILPNKLNMFMLFCRFFKFVHPFVPVVDENSLLLDIGKILEHFPDFNHEYYTQVSIESENDLHVMGIFLLVLRLGYMSLIHNDPANNQYSSDERRMIKDMKRLNPEEFVTIVNLCISGELIEAKSSFRHVQSMAILYFYRQVSPEDCHGIGGADSNILLGVAFRHAYSIGLNRDPTCYEAHESISTREPLIKTWRALWNFLATNDAVSAIHSGSSPNVINKDFVDVALPHYMDDRTGFLNDTIQRIETICDSYRSIVNKINNVRNKPKVVDILYETNHLEKIFFDFFGKDFFKDYICKPASSATHDINSPEHEESYLKVIKYCTFIQLRTNLSCMYYMIAIHYENEYNESKTPSMNAGIELFKIYIKSVVQLVYIMSFVLDNSVELFGRHYDYVLTASNERCMIKTHSFLASFFVRLLHYKMDLTKAIVTDHSLQPRLEVIDKLFSLVLVEAELFVGNFRKLSRTYMNSYKLYVMTYFVLKQCMENPHAFFETTMYNSKFFHKGTNMLEFFTNSELHHLCKLCEDFRAAKEEELKKKLAKRANQTNSESYKNPKLSVPNMANFDSMSLGNMAAPMSNMNSSTQSSPDTIDSSSLAFTNPGNGEFEFFAHQNVQTEDLLKLFNMYGDLESIDV
ncbi:uncharacterized protein RJT20DRAFT_93965 [Scheffersomyces xylosifermentans]|uniref:uncharacterized protein n=1 Tax=Scheffersomyces xylosifermentans TaxID=1304137 RepID=UPI00315D009F